MKPECDSKQTAPNNYVRELAVSNLTANSYRKALSGFQRFMTNQNDDSISLETLRHWLSDRSQVWPFDKLARRACLVDRFLSWMVSRDELPSNPFAELKAKYEQ